MNTSITLAALAAATSLLPLAVAQDPQAPARATGQAAEQLAGTDLANQFGADLVPIHTAASDNGLEYGVWAAGDRYKVSFHGDMTFIPYLGADYPTTQSLAWRTESVTAGGAELLTGHKPNRSQSEYRFEYQHGAVTEAYDVLVNGLEQTFVIHQKPSTSGDIVVRGALNSTLTTSHHAAAHRALDFVDANGDDILRYGEGYVFDAAGRRGLVTTSHREGQIELTVSGEWLQGAAWPVTIDPLISVTTVAAGTLHRHVDIVRDDVADDVMVCFTKGASTGDQDAYAYIMNDSFGSRVLVFNDVTTNWNTQSTQCATSGSPRKYCLVFSRDFGNAKGIRAHLHDSGDLALRTNAISITLGDYNARPDVGGAEPGTRFSPTGQNFMIVWQRDIGAAATGGTSIHGRVLSAGGALGSEFPIAISVIGVSDHERPSIAQQSVRSGSVTGKTTWMVALQRYPAFNPTTWFIDTKLVSDTTSNQVEGGITIGDSNNHSLNPKVAGRAGRYLVAFTHSPYSLINFKTASELGHSLRTRRIDWVSGGTPTTGADNTLFGPYSGRRMIVGGVAYDTTTASHWAVTSGSSSANGGSGRTIINRVGYNGRTLDSMTLQLRPSASEQGSPGGVTFNDDAQEFQASWQMNGTSVGRAWAARYTYDNAAPPLASGTGCSTATLAWSGSQQIGSEFSRMNLAGAVPNQLAWLVAGTSPTNMNLALQGMPGCALLVPSAGPSHIGVWSAISNGTGDAFVNLPLPEFLNGTTVYFQWFHVQPGTNALDLVSTQRMQVQLVK